MVNRGLWVALVGAAVAGAALVSAGCEGKAEVAPPAAAGSATVVVIGGKGVAKTHLVFDRDKVAALEGFFPDYHQRPTSPVSAGWKAGYIVYFDLPKGESIRLVVSPTSNAKVSWSMGQGDFAVKGDFAQFLRDLGD